MFERYVCVTQYYQQRKKIQIFSNLQATSITDEKNLRYICGLTFFFFLAGLENHKQPFIFCVVTFLTEKFAVGRKIILIFSNPLFPP